MRLRFPALLLALALAWAGPMVSLAPSARADDIIAPTGVKIVPTVVTLSAATDAVLGANPNGRKYLCLMNIGANPLTLNFDAAAVAGQGWALDPGAAQGRQGGWICFEASIVPRNVVHAISTLGTTVAVLEGN
jgi:hypothetical protein